jgi:hypothetical protein
VILKLTLLERLLHNLHLLPTPIMDAFGGVLFGRVLTIAVRRGVFEAVASTPKSIEEIAHATQLHPHGVELIVDAFVVAGYLKRSDEKYLVSEEGKKWLLKSSPHYLGNLIHYFETRYTRWADFEYTLEHGQPHRNYFDEFTNEDWKIYVYGMRDLAKLLLSEVRSKLILPSNPKSLLDIGGSHGLYAMECCRRHSALRATVMDFAPALHHTLTIAQTEGMADRVSLLAGDFTKEQLPNNQDCILMFNIIHGLNEEENKKLVAKAFGALNAGGKFFILDQMKEKKSRSGLSQFMPLMVGLNLLNEIGGNVYEVESVKNWCAQFTSVKEHSLRLPGVSLVEVVK